MGFSTLNFLFLFSVLSFFSSLTRRRNISNVQNAYYERLSQNELQKKNSSLSSFFLFLFPGKRKKMTVRVVNTLIIDFVFGFFFASPPWGPSESFTAEMRHSSYYCISYTEILNGLSSECTQI